MSAPSSNGCWKTGRRERVVHDDERPISYADLPSLGRACANLLMAAMSLISSRGFVGVSIQTSACLRRKRRFDGLQIAGINLLVTTPIG